MKLLISIVGITAIYSLNSMESSPTLCPQNYYRLNNNRKINHIQDIKYGPIILRVLAIHRKTDNYNESIVKQENSPLANSLKNFKVKSKEDLNKRDE